MTRILLPGAGALLAMIVLTTLLVGAAAAAPAIDVIKEVSADGGQTWADANTAQDALPITSSVTPWWKLTVRNTGDVALTDITITDTVVTISGTLSLDPGAERSFSFTAPWVYGLQENTATATDSGTGATDTDSAYYIGVTNPALDLVKEVSVDGQTYVDANTAADALDVPEGTNPQFRWTATNTGDVTLASITFEDSEIDLTGFVIGDIAPGSSGFVYAPGTWSAGAHMNTATATGTPSVGSGTATDTDVAYWTGVLTPAIDLEKYVWDGAAWLNVVVDSDGPELFVGDDLKFRYVVTNTGGVDLTDVAVSDDVLGAIGTAASLAVGASQEFFWSGTVVDPDPGSGSVQYINNIGTATGTAGTQSISDSDNSRYGVLAPTIDLEKSVSYDGKLAEDPTKTWEDADTAPGPSIPEGTNPMFWIRVENTGNVPLANVEVTDTVFGTLGTIAAFNHGNTQSYYRTGTWAAGQQMNEASAATTYAGREVAATDVAYWTGGPTPAPALTVLKELSIDATSADDPGATWFDADPDPVYVPVGTEVWYRITVTNSGNVDLTAVTVADPDLLSSPTAPVALATGEAFTTSAHVTAVIGKHPDTATASDATVGVTASDDAIYYGAHPALDITKEVSADGGMTWADANTLAEAPVIPTGTDPKIKFTAFNTGDCDLLGVTVTDSVYDLSSQQALDLQPGGLYFFIITVPWASGPHSDTATGTGTLPGGAATATDTDSVYWSGGSPYSDNDYVTWSHRAYAGKGTAATLLSSYWASAFPQGLEVGLVNGGNGYRWNPTSTGLANLKKFLTTGGTAGKITQDAFDPTKALYGGGTLATQTAALEITLRLDSLGLLGTAGNLGQVVYRPSGTSDSLGGKTVSEIVGVANTALGTGVLPQGYTYARLATLVGNLNTAFDGGKASSWANKYLVPPNPI